MAAKKKQKKTAKKEVKVSKLGGARKGAGRKSVEMHLAEMETRLKAHIDLRIRELGEVSGVVDPELPRVLNVSNEAAEKVLADASKPEAEDPATEESVSSATQLPEQPEAATDPLPKIPNLNVSPDFNAHFEEVTKQG